MLDPDSEKVQQAVMVLLLCAIMACIMVSGCCTFWRDTTFHFQQMKQGRSIRTITSDSEPPIWANLKGD